MAGNLGPVPQQTLQPSQTNNIVVQQSQVSHIQFNKLNIDAQS